MSIHSINYDTITLIKNAFPMSSAEASTMLSQITKIIIGGKRKTYCQIWPYKIPLYSALLEIVSQNYRFTTKEILRILKNFESSVPPDTDSQYKICQYRLDFYWLDLQIKNFGYKVTGAQQQQLDKLKYIKSFLLLEPANITHINLEYMFTISKVIHDILSNDPDDIKWFVDYIKKSKCVLTDICLANAFRTITSLYKYRIDTPKNDPYEKLMQFYDSIMKFFDLFSYKLSSDVAGIILACFHHIRKYNEKMNLKTLSSFLHDVKNRNAQIGAKQLCEQYHHIYLSLNDVMKHIDISQNVLTDDDIATLFNNRYTMLRYARDQHDFLPWFMKLKDLCNYKFSQRIFEYSIVNSEVDLFEKIILENTFECTPKCVKYAFLRGESTFIDYVLQQKIQPTIKDIKLLCIAPISSLELEKIIALFTAYNISLTSEIKEMLTLTIYNRKMISKNCVDRLEYLRGECTLTTNSSIQTSVSSVPLIVLRNMFRYKDHYTVVDIKKFIELHKIVPDVYCFENAIMTGNPDFIDYVTTEYNYIPTVPIIMKCTPWEFAVGLLYQFYPELVKFQYIDDTNILAQTKIIEDKKSITNQEDDTDSEGEKPVKKVTKKGVVTKKQKDDTDSEDEKPVKKVTKKGIVTKKQKDDTDSEDEKPVKKVTKKGAVTKTQKDDIDSEGEKPVKKVTKKGAVTKR